MIRDQRHTPEPWNDETALELGLESSADILRAVACVNACAGINPEAVPELLEAARNARNVLAGLVSGDLKSIEADSPALVELRAALRKAEEGSHGQLTTAELARIDSMFLRDIGTIRTLGADALPLEKLRARVLDILQREVA